MLFALARALGEAWPGDLSRDALVKRAFRAKHADESHRARLRVEIGRLRAELRSLASVSATTQGFALAPRHACEVVVLAPPVEDQHAAVIAFLADGESWSSSALALALGVSARTVQRALWVGQHRGRKIHQIDPETGAILRTIESNRVVTGVTWIDGELWHGTWEGDASDVRRVDPRTGQVIERLEMPAGVGVSGIESDGGDRFFCGGGSSGKVRAVRRPRRRPAAKSKK